MINDKNWTVITSASNQANWSDYTAQYSTVTGECLNTSCWLYGIDYSEYIWASASEVDAMIMQITGSPGLASYISNISMQLGRNGFDQLILNFGATHTNAEQNMLSALTRTSINSEQATGIWGRSYIGRKDHYNDVYALQTNYSKTTTPYAMGGWFYRTASVPTPATAILIWLGMIALTITRKHK